MNTYIYIHGGNHVAALSHRKVGKFAAFLADNEDERAFCLVSNMYDRMELYKVASSWVAKSDSKPFDLMTFIPTKSMWIREGGSLYSGFPLNMEDTLIVSWQRVCVEDMLMPGDTAWCKSPAGDISLSVSLPNQEAFHGGGNRVLHVRAPCFHDVKVVRVDDKGCDLW